MSALRRCGLPQLLRRGLGVVVLLAGLAYGSAIAGVYVFDDVHSVASNAAVHDLGNLLRFFHDPTLFSSGSAVMYRPVLLASFALNLALGGEAHALKAGNVLLHAAVAGLLCLWAWHLSRRLRAAVVVAALFAVHPLASEAVNLVSARSELLLAFGTLLGLLAHLAWLRRDGRAWALLGVLLGTVIACGSKETGVMLPLLCMVQTCCVRQQWPRWGGFWRGLRGALPAVLVVVVYLVLRQQLLGQVTVQLLGRSGGDPGSGSGRTLVEQLATMGALLPGVLLQCLAPLQLSLDPAVTFRSALTEPAVLLGWASMLALTGAALWHGPGARLRRLGAALLWLLALPWIVIPLNAPLAEHRLYGPLLGLALVAVAGSRHARALLALRHGRPLLAAAFAAILLAGVVVSTQRSWLYRDESTLWRAEIAQNARSFRAHWGLGTSLLRTGEIAAALEPLAVAHSLYPQHPEVLMHYVEALLRLPDAAARPQLALAAAAELAQLAPVDPWFRALQVQAHLQAGRLLERPELLERAEQLALSCLDIAPAKGLVYQFAAQARRGLGDRAGALAHLDAAIARGLSPVGLRLDRVALLRELGQLAAARRELLAAQAQAPLDPAVLEALQQFAAPTK